MNRNPKNIKDKSNENIFPRSCNLNVSSSSKGKPQDELDTNKGNAIEFERSPGLRTRETVHIKQLEKEFFGEEKEILEGLNYARLL